MYFSGSIRLFFTLTNFTVSAPDEKHFCSHKPNINPMWFHRRRSFSNDFFLLLFHFLKVPPTIDDSLSSSDVIVREGSNVTLKCRAHGSPQPTIKWKRDDNTKINVNKSVSGEFRQLWSLTMRLIKISSLQCTSWTRKSSKYPESHVWIWELTCASHTILFHRASARGLESASTVSTAHFIFWRNKKRGKVFHQKGNVCGFIFEPRAVAQF